MNKSIRNRIVKQFEAMGYGVTHIEDMSNRLFNDYKLAKPDTRDYIECIITNEIILFKYYFQGNTFASCTHGILLTDGTVVAWCRDNVHFTKLVDLVVAMRDLLKVPIPTIIL